jgi:hypothetical protein
MRQAPLTNGGCPGGPPTATVCRGRLTARRLIPGMKRSNSTARSSCSRGSPALAPHPMRQRAMVVPCRRADASGTLLGDGSAPQARQPARVGFYQCGRWRGEPVWPQAGWTGAATGRAGARSPVIEPRPSSIPRQPLAKDTGGKQKNGGDIQATTQGRRQSLPQSSPPNDRQAPALHAFPDRQATAPISNVPLVIRPSPAGSRSPPHPPSANPTNRRKPNQE